MHALQEPEHFAYISAAESAGYGSWQPSIHACTELVRGLECTASKPKHARIIGFDLHVLQTRARYVPVLTGLCSRGSNLTKRGAEAPC